MLLEHLTPYAGTSDERRRAPRHLDSDYERLIAATNGGTACSGALHVYGWCDEPFHDVSRRNEHYAGVFRDRWNDLGAFAEDAFGNPFCFAPGKVVLFDLESASSEPVADSFAAWAQRILDSDDRDWLTGEPLRVELESTRKIEWGQILTPIKPFVIGGAFEVANLRAMDWRESIAFRGHIARELADLPDGTYVELVPK